MTAVHPAPATRTIEVAEHQQAEASLTDHQARQLQAAAGARLTLTPSGRGYLLRASSHIGSISIPGVMVHVVPKIPVDNVLHLLTWSTHRIGFDHTDATHATHNLTAAVAAWYARLLERALILGIDRAYIEEADRLVALRGRVDWPAQANAVGLPTPITCRFDEWSIDTRTNRIVAAAALTLLRNPVVTPESGFQLRRLLKLLPGVSTLRADDLTNPAPLISRLNQHYDTTVHLARLILREAGPAHGGGGTAISTFLVDMNAVFEDFVFTSLRARLRATWNVTRQQVVPLGAQGRVPGEPDLLFHDRSGKPVLVADSKYKLTNDGRGRSSDYYQLLAYCTALGLPRGVLIYADSASGAPPPARTVQVRNAQTILETVRVRLSGSPQDISREVDRLTAQLIGDDRS